jgi:hypothetical protein
MVTRRADDQAFAEVVADRKPTAESKLTDSLMRMIRRTTITAAPPAHIRPTVWSDAIDISATIALPAAVSPYQVACTFIAPVARGARIEQYGVTVQDPTYTYNGSIIWAFRLNGAFLANGLSGWGEQRGSTVFPRKTVIIMQPKDRLDFLVARAVLGTNGTQSIQMGFRGWQYRMRNNYIGTQGSATAY